MNEDEKKCDHPFKRGTHTWVSLSRSGSMEGRDHSEREGLGRDLFCDPPTDLKAQVARNQRRTPMERMKARTTGGGLVVRLTTAAVFSLVSVFGGLYLFAQDDPDQVVEAQNAGGSPGTAAEETDSNVSESIDSEGNTGDSEGESTTAPPLENPQNEATAAPEQTPGLLPELGEEETRAAEILEVLDPPLPDTPVAPLEEPKAAYRLGVGDILGIKFHGNPLLDRIGVKIAPDGTIGYLESKRVKVSGMTVPEVREELQKRLAESRQNPTLIVFPVQLGSKRYTILGMIGGNGIYPLTKRTRLLEALALSGGVLAGGGAAGPEVAADFNRSFVVRNGEKLDIDFEQLYMHGNLEDNILLENGDYIYIASNSQNRCYVLGSVRQVSSVSITPKSTVMSVITAAGGYADGAWRGKVLLIRGSLSQPEVTVVDTADILKGKAVDVVIEPGDLIYVHDRPFRRTARLVDTAIKALIRGAIAGAIDDQVGIGI